MKIIINDLQHIHDAAKTFINNMPGGLEEHSL